VADITPPIAIAKTATDLPPGRPGLVVPHYDTFVASQNLAIKAYRWNFDEALFNSYENAYRMRFDPAIEAPLRTRQRSVVCLSWHLAPEDEADPRLVRNAANLEKRIRRMPALQNFLMTLKEDIWYGRSGAQVMYRWQTVDDRMGITPVGHLPIHGDKLVWYQNGDVGIRVSAMFEGSTEIGDYGRVHRFTPEEREGLVLGHFEPEDGDYRKPYRAGTVFGCGLRDRLYWFWSLKNQCLGFLSDWLRWYARGLTVYYYDANNPSALAECQQRIQQYQDSPILLWPEFSNGGNGGPSRPPIERISADGTSSNILLSLLSEYFDPLMTKLILGQTLTTGTGSTGLGSGVALAHMMVSDQVVKYDSRSTEDYLTQDLVRVMNDYTFPGDPCPRWVFEVDAPNVGQLTESIQLFTELGGKVGEETTRKELGIPDLKPGETPLGKIGTLDPTALNGTPADTPQQTK